VREVQRHVSGTGALRLFWRTWYPDAAGGGGRVLIAHGYAEHGGRYRHVAERLTEVGLAVVVPDHRGHGRSEGRPVSVERFDHYVDDLHSVAQAAVEADGEAPTVLIGHSLGGLIATLYALRFQEELAGLVLSAPAVVTEPVSGSRLALARFVARVAPEMGVRKLPLNSISRDPAVVAAYQADPWVRRRPVRARLGLEIVAAVARAEAGLSRLTLPLLAMQGGEDHLVDPSAARHVHAAAGSADRTLLEYPGLYHEIFNEPERDRVLDDLVGWVMARVGRAAGTGGAASARH
jgi:alpha-beta hydrolase superfamily lysophospholipase